MNDDEIKVVMPGSALITDGYDDRDTIDPAKARELLRGVGIQPHGENPPKRSEKGGADPSQGC